MAPRGPTPAPAQRPASIARPAPPRRAPSRRARARRRRPPRGPRAAPPAPASARGVRSGKRRARRTRAGQQPAADTARPLSRTSSSTSCLLAGAGIRGPAPGDGRAYGEGVDEAEVPTGGVDAVLHFTHRHRRTRIKVAEPRNAGLLRRVRVTRSAPVAVVDAPIPAETGVDPVAQRRHLLRVQRGHRRGPRHIGWPAASAGSATATQHKNHSESAPEGLRWC